MPLDDELDAVRPPAVAGFFYPADRAGAMKQVQTLDFRARRDLHRLRIGDAHAKAVIVPHAGWVYSGRLAAQGWAILANDADVIERVVLIGPTHRVPVAGVAAPEARAFETPLGLVQVAALSDAARDAGIIQDAETHAGEHALEVQVPFIQMMLPHAEILPLNAGMATADQVADAIESVWGGPETRIAVSTDLSHYLPRDVAVSVDEVTIDKILELETPISPDEACGATPLNGIINVCRRRGLKPTFIDHSDSSEASGDDSRVVGYASFMIQE